MPEREYQRLTRWRMPGNAPATMTSRFSLWLGSDHLLSIESSGFSEQYKRFYFRDIQALTFCQTRRAGIWNVLLAIPCVLSLALALTSLADASAYGFGGAIAWTIVGGVFGALLGVNIARGPACVTSVQTAVQIQPLPSLSRVRQTRRVLERLRPLIEEAQRGERSETPGEYPGTASPMPAAPEASGQPYPAA